MNVISATGGSGSSFLYREFKKAGWKICLRPDGGSQKNNCDPIEHYKDRTRGFLKDVDYMLTEKGRCDLILDKLRNKEKTMVLCMTWGGLGFLQDEMAVIYLLRNPLYAFTSYSGGGWRKEGGEARIKKVGAKGPNDIRWVDAFFGWFSHWSNGARYALDAHNRGTGYIVRYDRLPDDWKKLPGRLPKVYKGFECKDDFNKVKRFLDTGTIDYIQEMTHDIWSTISKL